MALIHDDKVEEVPRQGRILRKRYGRSGGIVTIVVLVIIGFNNVFALQQREQALDSGDNDIRPLRYSLGFQTFDRENRVKSISVLRQAELAELVFRLLPQIIAVHKEQYPPHGGVGEETV